MKNVCKVCSGSRLEIIEWDKHEHSQSIATILTRKRIHQHESKNILSQTE